MFIIAIAFLGLITMWLWNWLIPDLFHGPELDYLHAVGLLVLARVLVGIRGGRRGWRPWHKWSRHRHWRNKHWGGHDDPNRGGGKYNRRYDINFGGPKCQDEWWHKFANMPPEERRRVKEEWKADKAKWKSEFKRHFDSPAEPKPGDEVHPPQ